MVDKAPLEQARYTEASTELVPVLVACHSDSAGQRLGLVYHHMRAAESFLETCWCTHLAERHSVIGLQIDATGTAQSSTAPDLEQLLDGPNKTLAQEVC